MTDDQGSSALLPCPFCGNQPNHCELDWLTIHRINCLNDDCPTVEVEEATFEIAKEKWNTRVSVPAARSLPDWKQDQAETSRLPPSKLPVFTEFLNKFRCPSDGFTGTCVGAYTTLEGHRGLVLQQDGSYVIHVYRLTRLVRI